MNKTGIQDWKPFGYDLPEHRIAQRPVHPPESAKLLVHRADGGRTTGAIEDRHYSDLSEILSAGDLLIFNQTQVSPARIRGTLAGGGAAEFLLLRRMQGSTWLSLARPIRKLAAGVRIDCGQGLEIKIVERASEKEVLVELRSNSDSDSVDALLDRIGEMPIPPYIRKGHADQQDRVDYQSIFAQVPGSVAAPTASLHFSRELMTSLSAAGVDHAGLVLHLGSASFLPIYDPERSEDLMPPGLEYYVYSEKLLQKIAEVRERGGRVVAVGTSVVRALETMARSKMVEGDIGESELFITPGFEFLMTDVIATNFHQPGTTHLLLVESFIGRDSLSALYSHALSHEYRFLSYGDGMILFPGNTNE